VRLRAHLGQLPEPQHVDAAITALSHHVPFLAVQEMLAKAEGFLFTLADATAAVTTDAGQTAVDSVQKDSGGDWLSGVTGSLEVALMFLKDGLTKLRVPYAYGFAIILLTFLVKAATYPLTKSQVESTLAMQNLNPKIKAIQQRYQGDQVVTSLQQMFLCRKA
jgi:YidC/Oxa1 family membrane protein insertase